MSLLKRTTHQPQPVESIPEPKQGFIQIDFADIDTVIDKKLTAAEMKLWLYLSKIDRFGDRFVDLPTPKELAIRLGLSQRTVEKAMFRLDELKLYTIRIKAWQGANSSAARARQTAEALKQAKKDRTTPEPLPDKDGYLAANPVNFSEAGKINRESEKLTENPANFSDADIYRSHAYSDLTDLTDCIQTGNEPPPPTELPVEVEVVATEEEKHETPLSQETKNLIPTRELQATHEDNFSAAANVKFLEEIERIAYDWKKRPWMASATKFKSEMIKAVWQCNPTYYSIRGTQTPNQQHIVKALKLRDQQLQSLDELAVNAYHELNRWWNTAKALANPHVQHAFVAAANQSKEQVQELEKQRKSQQIFDAIKDL